MHRLSRGRLFAMAARGHRFLSPDRTGLPAWRVARELVAWLRGRRQRVRVRGQSMVPSLLDGDRVLVRRISQGELVVGQVVVFRSPADDRVMVKRVRTVVARSFSVQTFSVQSDAVLEGTDSRHFGSVPWENLIGVVTLVWRKTR